MIELQAGDLRLTLDPDTGGAIAGLTFRGMELLRPVADPRLTAQHGRAVAAYPLIPYANRIQNGGFTLGGESFQLARNFGSHPHTIHGNAWMRPWSVVDSTRQTARLTLSHTPPQDPAEQWPFAYRAEQAFELGHDALSIDLTLENRDARPWPAGLGLHPYVARTPEATLRFEADTLWTTGPDALPEQRLAVQGAAEFSDGRLLGAGEIDACYAGWGGTASVTMPEHGIMLVMTAAPPLDHLQVYTPVGCDYLGVEPVSNMPDAINRIEIDADHGLHMLPPGATLTARIVIGIRANDD